jgi:hypothetical protein
LFNIILFGKDKGIMTRKHFAVAVVFLALAWLCQPFESRAATTEFFSNDDALTGSMPMEFIAAGPMNGVIYPATRTYYFQNKSNGTITWQKAGNNAWLNVNVGTLTSTATTGTLAAGKVTSVTLSFTAAANDAVGVYVTNFTFTDVTTGEVFTRRVQLTILAATAPMVYFKFDETTGTTINDYSGNLRTGTLRGGATLDPFAKSGMSSYANLTTAQGTVGVSFAGLNINSNTFTQCLWVYPTGNQTPDPGTGATLNTVSGLLVHRGTSPDVIGLQWISPYSNVANPTLVGPRDQLGYNWADDANNYNYLSGLVPVLNQWNFVALVVTQDAATIWLYDGSTWKSNVHTYFHPAEPVNGTAYVGWDSNSANRVTTGYIDEVQEFGYSLGLSQLQAIALQSDPAVMKANNPMPVMNAPGVLSKTLHWTPSPAKFDAEVVYLGTFLNGVTNATSITSAQGLGIVTGATIQMNSIAYATQYYWRVDTVRGSTTTKGDIWAFQTGPNPATQPVPYAWYRLDDTTGTTVADTAAAPGGGRTGTLFGYVYKTGKARGNARWVGGRLDGGLHLDRLTTTSVFLPTLNLTTVSSITMTAWIRPNATSLAGSTNEGIVTYGTGLTSSGLTITNKGDLGGLWNGTPILSNGLIPKLNGWNFVAMSVSPTTTTLYLDILDGSGPHKVTTVNSPAALNFDGTGRIGYADVGHMLNHLFSGDIDDVRIYKGALNDSQVFAAETTATPFLPDPATGFKPLFTGVLTTFSWTAANAQVHDVYLDISKMTNTPGTPSYVGTLYGPPVLGYTGLELQTRYTFAIDESNTGGVAFSTGVFQVRTIVNAIDKWINYMN